MKKFNTLTSKIIPVNLDNVDTDMIIPAQHLTSISKSGYGEALFSNLRKLYPDFILNQPQYSNGKILVSKHNFGCGSSREHAVWAIQQYGINVVICSSFSDIFFNNSAKNGLLLIIQPDTVINSWLASATSNSQAEMQVDLVNQTISYLGKQYSFDYDSFRKHCLLNGQDDLDYLLSFIKDIESYESKYCSISR